MVVLRLRHDAAPEDAPPEETLGKPTGLGGVRFKPRDDQRSSPKSSTRGNGFAGIIFIFAGSSKQDIRHSEHYIAHVVNCAAKFAGFFAEIRRSDVGRSFFAVGKFSLGFGELFPARPVLRTGCPLNTHSGVSMTAKPPPVPPANRSDKGPGSAPETATTQGRPSSQTKDPDKIGQAGNSKVNTTHQGYQQDR